MILVTGGAGFIGAHFIRTWLAQTDEPVINLDKLTYAGNKINLASLKDDSRHQFIHGDIADGVLLDDLLARHRPRAILNFAAETHVDRSIDSPAPFIQTNIVGTFQLLEATRRYYTRCSYSEQQAFRFLQISTDEVYGDLEQEPAATELSRYRPSSPYAATKASADHLVRAYHRTYDLPVLISHCTNNYGPFQYPEKLIPLMLRLALSGQPLPLYGDGLQRRDWLHVSDHCSAVRHIVARGSIGESYNIGGNCELTNLALVEHLCGLLDQLHPRADQRRYRDQISFVSDRPGHDRRYALDTGKLATHLAWQPRITFAEGMATTVNWYLEHPAYLNAITEEC